ncbi:MAG TPA: hypothetical protein VFD23_05305, partial [Clostridia bacterium]|nr:hypothetical protein [Clostridia bacterium]
TWTKTDTNMGRRCSAGADAQCAPLHEMAPNVWNWDAWAEDAGAQCAPLHGMVRMFGIGRTTGGRGRTQCAPTRGWDEFSELDCTGKITSTPDLQRRWQNLTPSL